MVAAKKAAASKSPAINTKAGKKKFAEDLTKNITAKLIKATAAMPDDWDGIEIRHYLNFILKDETVEHYMRGNTNRGRAFAAEIGNNQKL